MIALVEKYQPRDIAGFIGLSTPRAVLQKLVGDPYASAWLLLGPSGTGKTTMAMAAAKAIGGQLHHIRSTECTIDRVDRLLLDCQYHPMLGGDWHCGIVDEADSMSATAQKAFLSVLDTTGMPANAVFFFTANATELLQDRFLSRLRRLVFQEPKPADLAAFLARIWLAETGGRARKRGPDFAAIAHAAGGNIRSALMTLETELLVAGVFVPGEVANPRQRAIEMHARGMPLTEVASQLGVPYASVFRWTA